MPRIARIKEENAIYHVMSRGNNREPILSSEEDKIRYLETLKRYKERYQIQIYAYCVMDNHVHVIIDSNGQDISKIVHGINVSYAQYINRKYKRCGHIFQDRFKSEIIDNDEYMLTASQYIHDNPVRAGMTKTAKEYKWSSIGIYGGEKDKYKLVNEEYILKYFSEDKAKARELYFEYMKEEHEMKYDIHEDKYENSDKKVEIKGSSTKAVLQKVALCFNVSVYDIIAKNTKRYAKERQLATYLIRLKSKITYSEIGKKLGICGSAVGQNITKAIQNMVKDAEMRKYFEIILQS